MCATFNIKTSIYRSKVWYNLVRLKLTLKNAKIFYNCFIEWYFSIQLWLQNWKQDLEILKYEFKYYIKWFTLDWSKAIIKVVENVYPEVKIQRCLTYIYR